MRRIRSNGFTLIELLIVIAVVGLLVGLLMPAIQAAREAARRTQCVNRLRQLGVAIQNFESSRGHLPPGYVSASTGPRASGERDPQTWDAPPGWGWAAQLLPYLEEATLADQLRFHEPVWSPYNRPYVRTQLAAFLCPSVPNAARSFVVQDETGKPLVRDGQPIELGRSHYVASHGQESCWGECGADESGIVFTNIFTGATKIVQHFGDASKIADGPFYRNSRTRLREIRDGLTKTIFLGEHASTLSDKSWAGVVPGAFVHPRFASPENSADAAATMVLVHAGPSGGELDITGFPIIHPVNFPTYHVGQMYAVHPGGGNVALGDSSVRFVSEDVDLLLWAAYSSMAENDRAEGL